MSAHPSRPRRRRHVKSGAGAGGRFAPPPTVSHGALLVAGDDIAFRETLYLMVLAFDRLITCREAFGRALGLTGSQFAVLFGVAYRQGREGVSIRALAEHVQLAATHVTTEVGRLVRKGLLAKTTNRRDRRGVLVNLTRSGEAAVRRVSPFLRRVNDLLFLGVTRREFAAVDGFLRDFARNGEQALAEIRRAQQTQRRAPAKGK
ncbi:MAG TPA: MarR family transcriptional regulator [Xanthobacteraceae bacterium]|nr:MarR family transcriptional regulator [Xanthobacteraceae bacterium]